MAVGVGFWKVFTAPLFEPATAWSGWSAKLTIRAAAMTALPLIVVTNLVFILVPFTAELPMSHHRKGGLRITERR
jgi:hypothetical protein